MKLTTSQQIILISRRKNCEHKFDIYSFSCWKCWFQFLLVPLEGMERDYLKCQGKNMFGSFH
jgi:hypothetical protein